MDLRRVLWAAVAASALALLSGGCGGKKAEEPLSLTVVPYEAAQKLTEEYGPMADYLAKRTGKPAGKFMSVQAYSGVLAALKTDQVDVAYLSPFPYVLASTQMQLHDLAMPYVMGSLMYRGIIFVRADSPIRTLQDLRGRTFAFGDPASTSGYLLPRMLLEKQGVLGSLKRWYHAGDANMVATAVENRAADAGAAYESVFQVVYKDRPEKARLMRVIGYTEQIPNGIYVARPGLSPTEVEKLRQAFMSMNTDPVGRAAMLKAPNDKIVPADRRLFEHVRETVRGMPGIDVRIFDKVP